ncbi:hypothetical protein TWF718_001938 [Orbilia javanica]|uniref:Uncharacterized protein n=1 Tax=Orbilia javanica TaxID=47235 RepID=A0AAN8RHR7_9PEZI
MMHPWKTIFFFFLLSATTSSFTLEILATRAKNQYNPRELCINQHWIPGTCVIQLHWSRLTTDERDVRWGQKSKVTELIKPYVFDANGTSLEINPSTVLMCNGEKGSECVVNAGLSDPILLSPQIQNDYLQFYFGNQAWHTDPEPKGKSDRPFVGDEYKDLNPWCEDKGWVQWPKQPGSEYFDPPYDRKEIKYLDVKTKNLTCWFDCLDIKAKWGDSNVSICPPPSTVTDFKTRTRTKTLKISKTTTFERIKTKTVKRLATKTLKSLYTKTFERPETKPPERPTTKSITIFKTITLLRTETASITITKPPTPMSTPMAGPEVQTQTVVVTRFLDEAPVSTVTETETITTTIVLTETVTDIPFGYTLVQINQL